MVEGFGVVCGVWSGGIGVDGLGVACGDWPAGVVVWFVPLVELFVLDGDVVCASANVVLNRRADVKRNFFMG